MYKPKKGGGKEMKTDGHTINGREMTALHARLESAKELVRKTLTKERIADAVVCASTVAVLALILDILYRAMESQTVVGTAPF
jgi:hypothetical protein